MQEPDATGGPAPREKGRCAGRAMTSTYWRNSSPKSSSSGSGWLAGSKGSKPLRYARGLFDGKEYPMQYQTGQCVRLKCSVPEAELQREQLGVVRSRWCDPLTYYEVEFPRTASNGKVVVVLSETQFEPADSGLANSFATAPAAAGASLGG
jgi:hypothetical protein